MAGSKHTTGGSAVYLSVSDGKLVQSVSQQTEDSVSRVNKSGKTVHEVFWRDWTGTILGIEKREHPYGEDWCITVHDGTQKAVIKMQVGSRYATEFAKRVPNLDLTKEVRIMPWSLVDEATQKKKTGIALYQDGIKVAPYYTKDSAEQMPNLNQVKVSGKMVWDSTDLDEFVAAILMGINGNAPQGEAQAPETNNAPEGEQEPPF